MIPGQSNSLDPINKTGPERQKAMFDAFVQIASGSPSDIVLGAALNLLVNALRQSAHTKDKAERDFNELVLNKGKSLLFEHYDSVTGKRRSVFPFTQVVEMPFLLDKDRKH
jgi:hypothetical protein